MTEAERTRSGMVTLQDGLGKSQSVQLLLYPDTLLLQREDWVSLPLEEDEELFLTTGLGLCVKGGSEHNLPVLISRILPHSPAHRCGKLLVGDAILKVNEMDVEGYTHDQVVSALKSAEGDVVTLTVRHFRPASHFLNKNIQGRDGIMKEPDHQQVPGLPRIERQWSTILSIPLLYARLSRYFPGTDKLRCNSFEVVGADGSSTGPLYCEDNRTLAEWMQSITQNINCLLSTMMSMSNKLLVPEEFIHHMCWTDQKMSAVRHLQAWKHKFLVLKGNCVFLFDTPPMAGRDWSRCDMKYKVYECMFKVLKDEELPDDRRHGCSVQTGTGDLIRLTLESRADLLQLERLWCQTNNLAVNRLGNRTFGCTWNNRLCGLTLDLKMGFSLYEHETKHYWWTYRFSQLKGSSDDGRSRLKLVFQNDLSRLVDTREIECTDMQTLIYTIHAFLSAKLASVDPAFLTNY